MEGCSGWDFCLVEDLQKLLKFCLHLQKVFSFGSNLSQRLNQLHVLPARSRGGGVPFHCTSSAICGAID